MTFAILRTSTLQRIINVQFKHFTVCINVCFTQEKSLILCSYYIIIAISPQKESLSHLIGLLTEISLQMKPLQTGYATHRFLSISWTDTVIWNALCELNMLSIYVQENTTRTPCSFIVKFRHLGIGERRTFALWMLGRINSALNLVPGLVSEYSRVLNQTFAWL